MSAPGRHEIEPYEIFAVKYARHERRASANFLGGDPHDGPMPLDFCVWVARGNGRLFIIDLGFNAATAKARQRELIRNPVDGLRLLGIEAATVEDVILTHLHYDHVGNFDLFPKARFHIQDKEMAYATGRHMAQTPFGYAYGVEDVVGLVREVYKGRVTFHDGDTELAPGLSLHHIGGHTMGLQIVRVWTRRGWVVLASDAAHLYANIEETRPFPIVYHVGEMVEGYRRIRALAESPRHIIPGHDPLVLRRYPSPAPALEGIVARLDVEPRD
jgi:glyoxylase-like metal-dependent hydrolase (beta-lactamase superfamily II)